MRLALYYTPPEHHPLSRAAAAWLGRDPWRASTAATAGPPGPEDIVREPRRYGFHATLKAPFRLAGGRTVDALRSALGDFCAAAQAVEIPEIALERIGPFFALVPAREPPVLQALAASVVQAFEPFRAPLTAEEVARRRPERLSSREREYLSAWGYPYVLDAFRFHMTLTGPVPEDGREAIEAILRRRFAAFIGRPLAVDALALFVEPDSPGDFVIDCAFALAASRG